MQRQILQTLIDWSENSTRIPLLLRGARQIGKTFIVRQLAAEKFRYFVEINFEYAPLYRECFTSLNPQDIVQSIAAISRKNIIAGETLLFLDEIQDCPRAIMALRYFKENMPDLHVIGAGSLLEFTIQDENFRMPVGRVQYLYMRPMSFIEFLNASKYKDLTEHLKNATPENNLPSALHQQLLALVRSYMLVGGMPNAVQNYIEKNDYISAQYQHAILLNTYRSDFGKYSKKSSLPYLQKVFDKAPALLSRSIKYTHIDATMKSRELKQAIENLTLASILQIVYATSATGLPLHALINEKKFKWLFLDIGLVSQNTQVSMHELLNTDITLAHAGSLAEQLVGQELLVYQDGYLEPQLHYWCRDMVGSEAEVDYVIARYGHIIPIEVKAGTTGSLKSLHLFLKEKNSLLGIRISEAPLSYNAPILSVPFYLISELPRLIDAILLDNPPINRTMPLLQ